MVEELPLILTFTHYYNKNEQKYSLYDVPLHVFRNHIIAFFRSTDSEFKGKYEVRIKLGGAGDLATFVIPDDRSNAILMEIEKNS